ncbi:Energy-dependent translational throttle protein EttA [Alphaproteobacteria bacterium SO-S41]|nr:Energy-dependent translational throttle protein EttA [Alphaproteobacteria bacterium SO-S41]
MSAFAQLRSVSAATPDGTPLFSAIDLSLGPERTGLVGRNGAGKSTLLRLIAGSQPPASGSVQLSGRIALLRQILGADHAETVADALGATAGLRQLERLAAGSGRPEDADADWTLEARLAEALDEVGLEDVAPSRRLATLSGGQRTRVALAALVFDAPGLILLDEPTNNLDREGRAAVARLLGRWRGGAVVASHDRALLRQMDRIVEISSLGVRIYGGNWDDYAAQKAAERALAAEALDSAERRVKQVDREMQTAREKKARRDAAGARAGAKGGIPRILLGAREDRAEASGGRANRLAERQRESATETLEAARARVERLKTLAVDLPSTGLAPGKIVLDVKDMTGGPGVTPVIRDVSFDLVGPERVAIGGPNGAGKTTLLRLVTGALTPMAGTVRLGVRAAMLDQDVALLDPTATIRDNFRRLNPADSENACRAALARFLFRADAALKEVGTLSGGERLRAGLACALGGSSPPQLLILDEPTNHLDLDSIAAMEDGLNAYDGALLVVSHDADFLEAIGVTRTIALAGQGGARP